MTDLGTHEAGGELRELLRPLWRHRFVIGVIVAASTIAVYIYNDRKPDQFRSSTQIFLQTSEVEQTLYGLTAFINGERNVANQAALVRTPEVARRVANRIGFKGDPSGLLGRVSVKGTTGTDLLVVRAVDGSAAGAAGLANAFAEAFVELRAATTRDQIQRALTSAKRQLATLPQSITNDAAQNAIRSRIGSLEAIQSLKPGGARQIDTATPSAAFAPQPRRAAVFAFVLSLVFGALVAFVLERLDRRIRNLADLRRAYGIPVLASLPHVRGSTISRSDGDGPIAVRPFARRSAGCARTCGSPPPTNRCAALS